MVDSLPLDVQNVSYFPVFLWMEWFSRFFKLVCVISRNRLYFHSFNSFLLIRSHVNDFFHTFRKRVERIFAAWNSNKDRILFNQFFDIFGTAVVEVFVCDKNKISFFLRLDFERIYVNYLICFYFDRIVTKKFHLYA